MPTKSSMSQLQLQLGALQRQLSDHDSALILKGEKMDIVMFLRQSIDHNSVFKFRTLRESLGILPAGPIAKNLRNFFGILVRDGILEEVPNGQRRNRDYHVKDAERLGEILNFPSHVLVNGNGQANTASGATTDKINPVKNKIGEQLTRIEMKLDKLIGIWS